jgi:putative transposase
MACATDSWRAEDARHRSVGAHRLAYSPNLAPATDSNLEDVSSQPPRPTGGARFLHRANGHHENKVLFVFIVLEHRRRQVLHFNVTEHPTAAWTSQQIVEAFADRDAPRYLLRDRDGIYGNEVRRRIASLGMEEVLTAPRSPWQNPYAERLIGSIRRDCLNHFVILNARHLRRTLASYFAYYYGSRTHLGLDKQCPFPRQVSRIGRIVEIPQLGGLHHRYERVAA